ncbi:MAG: PIN domain-containing protein, partial [Acidimicrobiales bacterium]
KALTRECSSRWAGRITKSSNDAYSLAVRNQSRALAGKEKAIEAVAKMLALSVHSRDAREALIAKEAERAKAENRRPRHLDFGYQSAHEHAMKRRRLSQLEHEATDLRAGLAAGVVHITRGGKRLMRNRLHLDEAGLLELLDGDLGTDGPVTVVAADQEEVEERALHLVREHALRAMDAWHLAVAALTLPSLVEPGEDAGFATRDEAQSSVAMSLGLRLV